MNKAHLAAVAILFLALACGSGEDAASPDTAAAPDLAAPVAIALLSLPESWQRGPVTLGVALTAEP